MKQTVLNALHKVATGLAPAVLTVAWAAPALSQPQETATTDTEIPFTQADRMMIAAQINHVVKRYFAHWEGLPPDYDWDARFADYLKEALAAPDRRSFSIATMKLIASLENGHSSFSDELLDDEPTLPFHARPIEGKWMVTSSFIAEVSPGDVITTVDGVPIDRWLEPSRAIVAQSDARAKNRLLLLQGRALWPQTFTLGLASGKTLTIDRAAPRGERRPARKPFEVETTVRPDGVVVIRIPSFDDMKFEAAAIAAVKTYAGAPLILFDVRGNGGGTTPETLLRVIMDRPYAGTIVNTPMTIAEQDAHASFSSAAPIWQMIRYGPDRTQPAADAIKGPMAVLMDGGCGSACEDFVIRFQSGKRGPLIGEPTFGSTGQPYFVQWPQWKMSFRISTKREFLPDGRPFEGVGVAPDIAVPQRVADLTASGDPQLDRAIAAWRAAKP
ncbi:S41 family peptidase [Erythrobacter sp. BLCC-B19]|uniref:S41 family peptidase n=1 Tax=Erythrobacter sp. BLCC-B19 TaxID=3025315 RepID=UPI002361BE2B|nr:S41 family peptidase [Erythrobacter sp. BLCC-B19]WDA39616.1 S41 family peptidase [Erythrobacter sp. BLCC-B19]